jgi:hypothetical protein
MSWVIRRAATMQTSVRSCAMAPMASISLATRCFPCPDPENPFAGRVPKMPVSGASGTKRYQRWCRNLPPAGSASQHVLPNILSKVIKTKLAQHVPCFLVKSLRGDFS